MRKFLSSSKDCEGLRCDWLGLGLNWGWVLIRGVEVGVRSKSRFGICSRFEARLGLGLG